MKYTPSQARSVASPFPRPATSARTASIARSKPKWWRSMEVILLVIFGLFSLLVLSLLMLVR